MIIIPAPLLYQHHPHGAGLAAAIPSTAANPAAAHASAAAQDCTQSFPAPLHLLAVRKHHPHGAAPAAAIPTAASASTAKPTTEPTKRSQCLRGRQEHLHSVPDLYHSKRRSTESVQHVEGPKLQGLPLIACVCVEVRSTAIQY